MAGVPTAQISVDRCSSLEAFDLLESEWSALVESDRPGNIFFSPDWVRVWWRHFGVGKDLWLICVRRQGALIGLAPMMLRRTRFRGLPVRMLRFITNRFSSRGGILAAKGEAQAVSKALVDFWRRHAVRWDVLALNDMSEDDPATQALLHAVSQSNLLAVRAEAAKTLYSISVEGDYQTYFSSRTKKCRNNIRRARRRFGATEVEGVAVFDNAENIVVAADRFFAIAARSLKEQHSDYALGEPGFRFLRDAISAHAAGQGCEIRILTVGQADICGLVNFRHGSVFYPYVTYYDPAFEALFPGWVLIDSVLSDVWAAGKTTSIDFNSDGENVRPWATGRFPLTTCYACNHWPWSAVIAGLRSLKRSVGAVLETGSG